MELTKVGLFWVYRLGNWDCYHGMGIIHIFLIKKEGGVSWKFCSSCIENTACQRSSPAIVEFRVAPSSSPHRKPKKWLSRGFWFGKMFFIPSEQRWTSFLVQWGKTSRCSEKTQEKLTFFQYLPWLTQELDNFGFACLAGSATPPRYMVSVLFFPLGLAWFALNYGVPWCRNLDHVGWLPTCSLKRSLGPRPWWWGSQLSKMNAALKYMRSQEGWKQAGRNEFVKFAAGPWLTERIGICPYRDVKLYF